MDSDHDWINRVFDQLDGCLEFESLGGMSWRLTDEGLLVIAPSGIEMVGGRDDGEEVFPFFRLEISELAKLFDEPPDISWSARGQSVWFEGKIDGETAWMEVRATPFDNEDPRFVVYPDGSVREK